MKAEPFRLRRGGPDDHDALGALMFDAVRSGESPYSDAQRAAWVPEPRRGADWDARIGSQYVIMAEDAAGKPAGFMSLAEGGYIDFAYILPPARGTGLFRRLFAAIAEEAVRQGISRLWVHASLMAEPAFAACGFTVTQREQVTIGTETLDRCEMELAF
ncbi:GNAT family N-acetyltransferase [Sphingosinithalassobacter portus]|uniref:GNAT family N-acetyltransferase n=1 Tax=Stakelama portus TaxID=2676234 RepID=UPI00137A6DA2|nr:GNAT family N-acetyltransferase [Sphingosinithalassobacter portus]